MAKGQGSGGGGGVRGRKGRGQGTGAADEEHRDRFGKWTSTGGQEEAEFIIHD